LDLLEESLLASKGRRTTEVVQRRLQETALRDVQELRPHLENRGLEVATAAETRLQERGEREARSMREILEAQKKRIFEAQAKEEDDPQRSFDFDLLEKRQLEANKRHWAKRLTKLDEEMATEPDRIRDLYRIQARRVEPVGLAYLWPLSG
jgi:hypothetical protein